MIQYATPAMKVVRYDGTNSAELAAAITLDTYIATVASEVDGVLRVRLGWTYSDSDFRIVTFHQGDWVMLPAGSPITAAEFDEYWTIRA